MSEQQHNFVIKYITVETLCLKTNKVSRNFIIICKPYRYMVGIIEENEPIGDPTEGFISLKYALEFIRDQNFYIVRLDVGTSKSKNDETIRNFMIMSITDKKTGGMTNEYFLFYNDKAEMTINKNEFYNSPEEALLEIPCFTKSQNAIPYDHLFHIYEKNTQ